MVTAHFIMQGKGGVGKSLSAGLLYQYLEGRSLTVQAMDTDPINKTLAGYKAFNVTQLEIMKGNDINQRQFDQITNAICEMPDGAHMIVDNGASSFVSLCGYIKENRIFDILTGEGHTVLLHSVVTGGQALGDTLANLDSLIDHFFDVPLIVWLNPFFGEITIDGNDFYSFKVYQKAQENYKAIIELPLLKADTFGKDFEELIAKRWSFNQAINSRLPLMTRSRLFNIWQDIERVIDAAHLV